jgi:hypothetical protein
MILLINICYLNALFFKTRRRRSEVRNRAKNHRELTVMTQLMFEYLSNVKVLHFLPNRLIMKILYVFSLIYI